VSSKAQVDTDMKALHLRSIAQGYGIVTPSNRIRNDTTRRVRWCPLLGRQQLWPAGTGRRRLTGANRARPARLPRAYESSCASSSDGRFATGLSLSTWTRCHCRAQHAVVAQSTLKGGLACPTRLPTRVRWLRMVPVAESDPLGAFQ